MTDCLECKEGNKFISVNGNIGRCFKERHYTVKEEEGDTMEIIDGLKIGGIIAIVLGIVILVLICYSRKKKSLIESARGVLEVNPTPGFKHTELP